MSARSPKTPSEELVSLGVNVTRAQKELFQQRCKEKSVTKAGAIRFLMNKFVETDKLEIGL